MAEELDKPLLDPDNFNREGIDLERIPLEQVFEQLKTSPRGLSSDDAEARLHIFGPNKLEERKENKILKFLSFMWNPLSWVMEAAALMAIVLANGGGEGPDWQDFVGIICLLVINSTISFIEENNAGTAAAALMARLAPRTKVLRDGQWQEDDAAILVPGDIISIKLGDIIPADARLLEGDPLKIDQATLTGESLPVTKKTGDEVFNNNMDKDMIVLLAARAARLENQDAIDAAIVNMLADPKEARANITEVHFLPFNPVDKRTALTYIDSDGNFYRASKGAPEQILNMCQEKDMIAGKVHAIIDKFAARGLRSLAVAFQEVPEKSKDSPGSPWTFCGLLPLFDPPRHDSAETILRALNLGVCVKMITGDQLAIAKETGRRLGMGTNMYPSSSLLGRNKDENEALPVDELIEKADGFAGVFPEHKYEIVKILQEKHHVVGMTGDGVNDAPALKKADIGIAVSDATDAARSAADIVLTEPGLSVIISALGFVLLALIWEYDFPPFMVLIIAILNDGTIMTIAKDRVKPSPTPDSWKLPEIFATGVVIGTYLALVTVLFYWAVVETTFFETYFHVTSLSGESEKVSSAVYLQVSIISQALIFVTRSRGWSFLERPGALLICAFVIAQLVATLIAVYANISFAEIRGIGWGWAGVIWLFSLIFYVPLDIIKFTVRYALSGEAWNLLFDRKTAFTSKKDYGTEDRAAKWVLSQGSLQGLNQMASGLEVSGRRSSLIAEQARRRAEIARLGELHTLRGHVESVLRLKNLDLKAIQSAHTV
ncbi:hypothetical protein TSUD_348330 [Trifolium subterraneum]|nr:hypothetical protein TSUD_348330 [Trifolium subterraneum]